MARPTNNSDRRGGRRSGGDTLVRKRTRFLEGVTDIDINDHELLRRFMTDHGKIIPARLTGVTAKQQRAIKNGIRRARNIGLLP